MNFLHGLVCEKLPSTLQSVPVPNSFSGLLHLSLKEWAGLVAFGAVSGFIGYSVYTTVSLHCCGSAEGGCCFGRGKSGGSASGRINRRQRLAEAKVVDCLNIEDLGQKAAFCRCWKSNSNGMIPKPPSGGGLWLYKRLFSSSVPDILPKLRHENFLCVNNVILPWRVCVGSRAVSHRTSQIKVSGPKPTNISSLLKDNNRVTDSRLAAQWAGNNSSDVNNYLSWCRNSYLAMCVGIGMLQVFPNSNVFAGMELLSFLTLIAGTAFFIRNLFFNWRYSNYSRVLVIVMVLGALANLFLFWQTIGAFSREVVNNRSSKLDSTNNKD